MFISYFLFSHISCDLYTIPNDDVDEDKVDLKFEEWEEKREEDDENIEVSDKEVDGKNDNKE